MNKTQPQHQILIAEDDLNSLRLLSQMLEADEYQVLQAPNGQTALQIARRAIPDLIILDIQMPGMDGYETCQQLKTIDALKDVPVIFISGRDETLDKVKAFQLGGVDYLTKPYQKNEMLARVHTHLHIRELTENLEAKVQERTKELASANQQLQQEIHERERAEAIAAARSRILQFSLTHELTDVLQNVLDECELLTESLVGFFHFVLEDQNTLWLQNWSTRTLNKFCFAEGQGLHYPISEAGIWAECVQERRAIICNEYAAALNRKGMPDGHTEVKRFISIPILRGDKIVAIIGMGNKSTDYHEQDVEAVTQLADLSWDIAERKQFEERIEKEHENFLKTFAAAPVGLLLLNGETEIVQANQAIADMALQDTVDLIGKRAGNALGCVNSKDNPKGCGFGGYCQDCVLRNGVENVLRGEQSIHGAEIELMFLIGDEFQARWLNIGAEPVELDGQQCVVVAIDDITERKQAEAALQKSRARIKSISDNITSGMIYQVLILPDGLRQFTYLSDSVQELYGASPEAIMADASLIYSKIHKDDIASLQQTEEEAIQNLATFKAEARVREPSGKIRWSSYVSSPTRLEDGTIYFDGIEFVITERKEQEAQIIAHQDELQRMLKKSDQSRRALLSALEDQQIAKEAIRKRLVEMEAVNHVSTALRIAQTADEMLSVLLDETLAALESEAGIIWLYQKDQAELRVAAARGWCEKFKEMAIQPGEGITGTVFTSEKTHIAREFNSDPLVKASATKLVPDNWGGTCMPIRTGDEIAGVICVSVPLPREITMKQSKLLDSLTEMAGTALHRLRLHEETRRQLEYLQTLHQIDKTITQNLGLKETMDLFVKAAAVQLHVDAVSILLLDRDQKLTFVAGYGFMQAKTLKHTRLHLGQGLAGRAARERKIVHVRDLQQLTENQALISAIDAEDFVSYYGAPLIVKGEVLGVLEIFHRAAFTPKDSWLDFLETLAGQAAVAIDNTTLFDNLQQSHRELFLAYNATLEGWSHALDLRDRDTEGHAQRVTKMAVRLAQKVGLSEEEIVHLRRGALLHDIGKMGIPDTILHKPGPLTEEEWIIMRKHPQYAYEMLLPVQYLHPALDIPHYHHEHWDGTGYPNGLKGEEIPLPARIFAIIDNWDALTSDRPYREAWSIEKTKNYLCELSGKYFDPQILEVFLELLEPE